jgi:hypothetical protein
LVQRDEFVSFVVWRVVNPGLQAALHMHRGGRWVDPPGSHKEQNSKRPKKHRSQEKPSSKGSESAFPMRGIRRYVWNFSHASE